MNENAFFHDYTRSTKRLRISIIFPCTLFHGDNDRRCGSETLNGSETRIIAGTYICMSAL